MALTKINGYQILDSSIEVSKIAASATLDLFPKAADSLDLNSEKIINLGSPSNSTDAATKGYVDSVATGLLEYKGVIDCSSNPNYPAAEVGDVYIVSVAGKIGGASGVVVEPGDMIICYIDNAGGDQAAVGLDFNIIQANVSGFVSGPTSATNEAVALFDGTTGKVIKNSAVTISEAGNIITSGSLGSTGSRVVKGWFIDLQVTNAISGSITGNAATVTTNANLTGDVTSTGNATTISSGAVTNAMLAGSIDDSKLATIYTADKVYGSAVQLSSNGGLSDSSGLRVNVDGSTITKPSGVLGVPSGGIGSTQLASNAVTTDKITAANVTLAKIANASANSKLLGSGASGSGSAYVELTLGTGLSMSGTTLNSTGSINFVTRETPSGTVNGTNDTFVLAHTPTSGSEEVYVNGVQAEPGSGNDYTISSATITFPVDNIPQTGDKIRVTYRY